MFFNFRILSSHGQGIRLNLQHCKNKHRESDTHYFSPKPRVGSSLVFSFHSQATVGILFQGVCIEEMGWLMGGVILPTSPRRQCLNLEEWLSSRMFWSWGWLAGKCFEEQAIGVSRVARILPPNIEGTADSGRIGAPAAAESCATVCWLVLFIKLDAHSGPVLIHAKSR